MSKSLTLKCTTPCKSCPYRKDAPLQLWNKKEFLDVLINEKSELGVIYACHKKNGSTCIGWLMMQDKNRFPSIMLRLKLSRENVTREYLDKLHCSSEMFDTTEEMVKANFPHIIKTFNRINKTMKKITLEEALRNMQQVK